MTLSGVRTRAEAAATSCILRARANRQHNVMTPLEVASMLKRKHLQAAHVS